MHSSKPLTIFFSAGEPSGDLHGANLIRHLQARRPGIRCVGYGGPQMAEAGCQLHADLTALAVMWFARVLLNLHKFWALASWADRYFRHHRPDAVVLIDYPGFNWWIARRAKAHGIPVFYYCPPQIWAWARWRVGKMRRLVDHVLCCLPFEADWFVQHGCNATYVGHPFFDEVRRYPYDEQFIACQQSRPGPMVLILPGSRTQEVTNNLYWFLKAATVVHGQLPTVRFAVAAFKPHQAELARAMAAKTALPIEVFVGKTPELIRVADCAMSVSGSVSLELLHHATPTVILYWISPLAYVVQGFFRKVKHITLVNLLAEAAAHNGALQDIGQPSGGTERVLFPEYLTCADRSSEIADHIVRWLREPASRAECVESLVQLRAEVGQAGSADRAAEYILGVLTRPAGIVPKPHFPAKKTVISPSLNPRT